MEGSPHMAALEPSVIGGLGGSGTRVFAEVLQHTGCYIGGNLNSALDYLTFTVLANRPLVGPPSAKTLRRVERLLGHEPMRPTDAAALLAAAVRPGHHTRRRVRLKMARRALRDRGPVVDVPWGFKEPNTARVLSELADAYPRMRFVHVVRHGLDMALSRNVHQLRSWGPSVGVSWSGAEADRVRCQLAFWLEATRQTHETGQRLLGDRYLLARYDDLIRDPVTEVTRLAEFWGCSGPVMNLLSHVEIASSSGRWLRHGYLFDERDRQAVAEWGFDTSESSMRSDG